MSFSDPMHYIRSLNLDPLQTRECASPQCTNSFRITDGVAHPGISSSGEIAMYFFCSHLCYLTVIPVEYCVEA